MCLRVEGGRGVRVLMIFFLKLEDLRGVGGVCADLRLTDDGDEKNRNTFLRL